MLEIPRRKLLIANILFIGGIVAMLAYILILILFDLQIPIIVLISGYVISIIGAIAKQELFRCPRCHTYLLRRDLQKGVFNNRCPEFCSECGEHIQVEIYTSEKEVSL